MIKNEKQGITNCSFNIKQKFTRWRNLWGFSQLGEKQTWRHNFNSTSLQASIISPLVLTSVVALIQISVCTRVSLKHKKARQPCSICCKTAVNVAAYINIRKVFHMKIYYNKLIGLCNSTRHHLYMESCSKGLCVIKVLKYLFSLEKKTRRGGD